MSIWKKAVSTLATAGLLASLLGTAVAGTALADTYTNSTTYLNNPVPSTGVSADGISQLQVTFAKSPAAGYSLAISISGATFAGVSNASKIQLVNSTNLVVTGDVTSGSDYFTVRAPATPGTATITVYVVPLAGQATLDGTVTAAFFASGNLNVSAANSVTKLVASTDSCSGTALTSTTADKSLNPAAKLCVYVADGNGNAVTNATVAVTITPVGLTRDASSGATAASAGTGQAASTAANFLAGWYAFAIGGSGLAGKATITVSATVGTATTSLAPASFTFTGPAASVTATAITSALNKATLTPVTDVVEFTAKDAAGNVVNTSGSTTVVTGSAFTAAIGNEAGTVTGKTYGKVSVTCNGTEGSGTVAVKTNGITSNAVKIYCSGATTVAALAFGTKFVAPGGTATLTLTAKDASGQPAYDIEAVAGTATPNSGAIIPGSGADNGDGTFSWTYLAPFSTGTATVVVLVPSTLGSTLSASITVGSAPVSVTSNGSALGKTLTGPFTTTTKVAAKGAYVTFKMSFGAADAGKTITIYKAAKTAAGTWGAWTVLTNRVANANGEVFVYVVSGGAWLSIRGTDGMAWTPAVQARWQ